MDANPAPETITLLYEQVVSSIDEMISGTPVDAWDNHTDLEGWSVRDNLAHLGAFEAIAAGLAEHAADTDVSHHPRAIGFNETVERDIELRRSWPVEQVVQEFRLATATRLSQIGSWDEAAWETTTLTPFGPMPSINIMPIRIIDLHYHEQDMRRATDNPGGLDGEVARFVVARMHGALPKIFGKGGGATPGQSLVINLTSHAGKTLALQVNEDGKAAFCEQAPEDPTLRIACDLETYLMLHGGRRDWQRLESEGMLTVTGDRDLASRVLPAMAVTP
ncbi:MAG: maleylpyruvate isomerase family mycothiol-dependent enzyme [Actinomycetota bacterium]